FWTTDVGGADEGRVRLAIGASHLGVVADDSQPIGRFEDMASGHSQIAPPVGGSGGGGHVLGRKDGVHFARLREGEQAAAVEMRGKVVGTREPEAFLDGEEFVLNRHAFSGLGFATCPSQRLTEASVPGLTGVVDEKGAVVASEAPEGEAGGAG